jgi:hypothetical protein
MRLLGPIPHDSVAVNYETYLTSPANGGERQCRMRRDRCCNELLWGKRGVEKCFVGDIRRSRKEAKLAAAEKFWQDRDVLKKAESLPPSKRQVGKVACTNDYLARRHLRRSARLAAQKAQNARSTSWASWASWACACLACLILFGLARPHWWGLLPGFRSDPCAVLVL